MRRLAAIAWMIAAGASFGGIALALSCAAAAPAQAAQADRAPDASTPDDEVTIPNAPLPPPPDQTLPPRPPVDPVEERVKYLHERLRITAAQEPLWSEVARAMRENAKAVAPLIRERVQSAERGSAIDNLGSYEKLGEAQLDGLKRFLTAFQALYDTLSPKQKKIADSIFRIGPLSMIGGIPQLPEALVALSPEEPYPGGLAYAPYPSYPLAPAYPAYPPAPAYPAYPPAPVYPPYPPALGYPPYAFSPYYPFFPPFYNGPWIGGLPVGVLIARRHFFAHMHPQGGVMHQHGAVMHTPGGGVHH